MATTFNMLRANDLIWSFVVNNYLLGKEPFPFDLLYWNSDSTRMPAAMHSFYLRNMYQKNLLSKPGGIELDGVASICARSRRRAFILSTREDHIAPWKATYAATQLYSGPVRFVLAASGHIAGVVNPPAANKYSHWTNTKAKTHPEEPGRMAGKRRDAARLLVAGMAAMDRRRSPTARCRRAQPGAGKLKAIEDAPGSYVKVQAQ